MKKKYPGSMEQVKKGLLIDMGVEEQSITTGNTSSISGSEPSTKVADKSDQEVGKHITEKAKEIQESLEKTGEKWASCTPKERMLAASASPAALYAELCEQISNHEMYEKETEVREYACKARAKTSKLIPETTPVAKPTESETKTPSIWKWGTGNPKKPSSLCVPAASVLMGILYGARMARYDLIRPVQALATFLHEWDSDCDLRLNRLISYIQSTIHYRQVAWVGDTIEKLGPHLYADADFAGCPRTLRSTSGYHLAIEGPWTSIPQTGASARQTALSNSTPEAEFAACHLAHKKAYLPSLDIYDKLLPEGYHKVVHEDNQAMIQIAHTGINKTMRWLSRNHGLAIRYLYEHLGNEETKDNTELVYTRSEWMAADIFTKPFNSKDNWLKACELVNVMDPKDLKDVIKRRAGIYQSLKYDQKWHPINKRPQAGNTATHRKWLQGQESWLAKSQQAKTV